MLPTEAAHGGVAQLHRCGLGHRVDDVGEAVLGVSARCLARMLAKELDGAVGFDEPEVCG